MPGGKHKWFDDDSDTPFSGHPGQDQPGAGWPGGAPYTGPGAAPPVSPPAAPAGPTPPGPTDYGSFDIPQYGGPYSPSYNFSPVPIFGFQAPGFDQVQNDPGYQFGLKAGNDALQNSAAAKGVLRTGGTLKDLSKYNSDYAAQRYQDVYNRQYQLAKDQYAPQFAQWQSQFGAEQNRGNMQFDRYYQVYQALLDAALRKEGMLNNVLNVPPPTFPGSV